MSHHASRQEDADRFPTARQVWLAHRYLQDADMCSWLGDEAQRSEFAFLAAQANNKAEAAIAQVVRGCQ